MKLCERLARGIRLTPARSISLRQLGWVSVAVSPRIEIEAHSTQSVLIIVAMGMALGFVAQTQAPPTPCGAVVREVEDLGIELPLYMVRRSAQSSLSLDEFGSALADSIEASCEK